MSCEVRTVFYDCTNDKEIENPSVDILINGNIATGDSTVTSGDMEFTASGVPDGYVFKKWSFSQNGGASFTPGKDAETSLSLKEDSISYESGSYMEVRCVIEAKRYTITYSYKNPDSENDYTDEFVYGGERNELLLAPSYSKHVFAGWRIEGELYAPESYFEMPPHNVTAEGEWIESNSPDIVPGVEIEYQDEDGNVIDSEIVRTEVSSPLKKLDGGDAGKGGGDGGNWKIGGKSKKNGSSYRPSSSQAGEKIEAKKEKNVSYCVRFDCAGGMPQVKPAYAKGLSTEELSVSTPNEQKKNGKTPIVSWRNTTTGICYPAGSPVPINKPCTLRAEYAEGEYVAVTFDYTDCPIPIGRIKEVKSCKIGKAYSEYLPEYKEQPICEDERLPEETCRFLGFFNRMYGGEEIKPTDFINDPKSHTVYGRWEKGHRKIIIHSNNNEGKKIEHTIAYGTEVNALELTAKAGWSKLVSSDLGDKVISPYAIFDVSALLGGKDYSTFTMGVANPPMNLYARYHHVVFFDEELLEEAEYELPSTSYEDEFIVGQRYVGLPTPIPVDEKARSYHFVGWFMDKDSTNRLVTESGLVRDVEYLNLYPHFSRSIQRVHFRNEKNSGLFRTEPTDYGKDPENNMILTFDRASQKYTHLWGLPTLDGKSALYNDVKVIRDGYGFGGWATSVSLDSQGYTIVDDEKRVSVGDSVGDVEDLYLFPIWDASEIRVTFYFFPKNVEHQNDDYGHPSETLYLSDATKGQTITKYYKYGEKYGTFPDAPTSKNGNLESLLEGWRLIGWFDELGNQVDFEDLVTAYTPTAGEKSTSRHLFARWYKEDNSWKVMFDTDGGTCSMEEKEVDDSSRLGSMPKPEKDGYSFGGWKKEKAQQETETPAVSSRKLEEIPLSATDGDSANSEYAYPSDVVTEDMTLKADWRQKIYLYYTEAPKQ